MTQHKSIAVYLLAFATAAMLMGARVRSADDAPPPVPYGTQQSMKLTALLDAAPFMAATEDDVQNLLQQRLRVCATIFQTQAERVDLGRASAEVLAEPMANVKQAWLAMSPQPEVQMPILKFALQLAEHREQVAAAMSDAGNISTLELLSAKRDRLTAEIELAQCQRALSSASVR